MAMGIVEILQPTSLKLIKGRGEKIYLSKEKIRSCDDTSRLTFTNLFYSFLKSRVG